MVDDVEGCDDGFGFKDEVREDGAEEVIVGQAVQKSGQV